MLLLSIWYVAIMFAAFVNAICYISLCLFIKYICVSSDKNEICFALFYDATDYAQ